MKRHLHLLLAASLVGAVGGVAAEPSAEGPAIALPEPAQVQLNGPTGAALARGVARLAQPPYTTEWLLADVSFRVNRIFTNYSGDVSGRFLELASLTSPPGEFAPATLQPVLKEIAQLQKPDGHFGLAMDFNQPMQKLSPPIPMLWGNARLLVGLVTAARRFHDPSLMAAARRLGDFYVATTNVFCSAAREAELRATGTGGDGYTCCYFPAIEGLTLLYRATNDARYLDQARRMAEWFQRFDALPTDHSHGNLCAWRGILELYDLTHDRAYLDRALAKWERAMQGGYVWALGGIGEHWFVFHSGDEGCSESDWLRFNLGLWRFTGETRFLNTAERLLKNQYPANQCANGGYGWRSFDGDAAGPIGTRGSVEEWNFCCSFHGPLGLHFLKSYLAAGSQHGVYVNFPLDFDATVQASDRSWRVRVRPEPDSSQEKCEVNLELAPVGQSQSASTVLWLRKPDWAGEVAVALKGSASLPFSVERGYLRLAREFRAGESIQVTFHKGLRAEGRRFQPTRLEPGRTTRLRDVTLLDGPDVLFATPAPGSGRSTLLAKMDANGRLKFWDLPDGTLATVPLPGVEAGLEQIRAALASASPIFLRPEMKLHTQRRAAFMHDVVVVPADTLPTEAVAQFQARALSTTAAVVGPFFGRNLEQHPEEWIGAGGWQFQSNTLHVVGGDVGLLDGGPYADYRFEFDLEMPREGHGLAGWVVRAESPGNCLLFQLQSADSPYVAPEFKTQPNTLRPHIRRNGEWIIADPLPLPKPVRRGETHQVAVECRGAQVIVFLDGEKVWTQDDAGYRTGAVGFRATGLAEQGLFRNIALRPL